ncbi:ribonuclease H2, subunit B [Syncephalis fuscata]|nr:ribonuclease H2, subunit B [Syncephalis fuscata]
MTRLSSLSSDLLAITLPHPRTGIIVQYVCDATQLLEIQHVNPDNIPASWFIDNTVQKDGSLLLFTPVDVLFILLPILIQCRRQTGDSLGVYCSQQDILEAVANGQGSVLNSLPQLDQSLCQICDTQDVSGYTTVYRLNDQRVITWLKHKIDRIVQHFDNFTTLIQMERSYLNVNNNQTASCTPSDTDEERQALRIWLSMTLIDDYLSDKWRTLLRAAYNLSSVEALLVKFRRQKAHQAATETKTVVSEGKGRRKTTSTATANGANKTKSTDNNAKKAVPPKGTMSLRNYFKPKST